MVALEQLFEAIKFVYLCGTDPKQSSISTNQNERKFVTTYLDPSFLVFSIHGKIRGIKTGIPSIFIHVLCSTFKIPQYIL